MFRSRLLFNVLAAIAGVGLLVFTVQRVGGWPAVVSGIGSVGWWFAAVVALGAARMAVRAKAWAVCARPEQLSTVDAFTAVLAGDTAGNLTPLGVLASEPTKILLARSRISTVTSVASVTIENGFYTASVLVVLLAGTWILLQRADVPASLEQISEITLGLIVVAAIVACWAARRRPAVLSRIAPLMTKLAGRPDAPAGTIRDIESRIYDVPTWSLPRLLYVAVLEALFHLLAVAEVWLVLRLLPGGANVALIEAFLMESAGRFVTIAFKFVPYRLGVDEIGSGAVAQVLGLSAANGVTLALVRRLRILVLNALGLFRLMR